MFSLKTRGDNGNQFQNLNYREDDRSRSCRVSRRESYADAELLKFIWAQNRLVDKEVLVQLNIGNKAAIRDALEQIHTRSLDSLDNRNSAGKGYPPKSFNEVLLSPKVIQEPTVSLDGENGEGEWTKVTYKKRSPVRNEYRSSSAAIFLHNIPDGATGTEI